MEIHLIKGFSKVIATVNEYQKMLSTIQLLKKKNKLKPHAVSLLKYQCLKLTNTISKPDKDVLMASLIHFFLWWKMILTFWNIVWKLLRKWHQSYKLHSLLLENSQEKWKYMSMQILGTNECFRYCSSRELKMAQIPIKWVEKQMADNLYAGMRLNQKRIHTQWVNH